MAKALSGKEVVSSINKSIKGEVSFLSDRGIVPKLAIVRVGERGDDISYERGASNRCAKVGVEVKKILLPDEVPQDRLLSEIEDLNKDETVHGILILRPLPRHIDDSLIRNAIRPEKDVDGITDGSMVGVYTGEDIGFPPCTPQACMEILDYYGIDVTGMNAVVIGRSLVVGKPAALMLIKRNATVTVCHTRTVDTPSISKAADLLIVSAGRAGIVGKDYLREGQIVIDVGINVNDEGKLCGDVDYEAADAIVEAVTPVPGGVGTVTTSVLVKHVVLAAKRQSGF
ncbi:MAG: bifunctional 5,10-methylenetetrahydrofolate dehydrogenase/5,10-methenyltetrahydrofolate cyclohydrolase [Clostridiales bacterium]|nr:bifunctional 5,10-methylenetetrahydrofolate dehydrogenase/5,10-methenyltetrahydrofolate cyclohydrolase [Clostridiales bacterium]